MSSAEASVEETPLLEQEAVEAEGERVVFVLLVVLLATGGSLSSLPCRLTRAALRFGRILRAGCASDFNGEEEENNAAAGMCTLERWRAAVGESGGLGGKKVEEEDVNATEEADFEAAMEDAR
jgi:hypothetical protein